MLVKVIKVNSVCNYWAKEDLSVLILLYWMGQPEVCVISLKRNIDVYAVVLQNSGHLRNNLTPLPPTNLAQFPLSENAVAFSI